MTADWVMTAGEERVAFEGEEEGGTFVYVEIEGEFGEFGRGVGMAQRLGPMGKVGGDFGLWVIHRVIYPYRNSVEWYYRLVEKEVVVC